MLRSRSFAVLLIFTALTLPAPVGPALAQSIDLVALVNRHTDEAIELRHRIHQNPELGNREHETAALVAEYLRSIPLDRKSTRLNSSHVKISYAVFCLKKKNR